MVETKEQSETRIENAEGDLKHLENVDIHDKALNVSALEATAQEHSIGFVQGFKMYKRAAFWSFRTHLIRFCHYQSLANGTQSSQ